ncbi:MAG: peptidoglycan DD-metalloendopeptidase family protein [Bosea sp. (in: a-proteobacteria)]
MTTASIARTTPVAGAAAGWSAQGGTPVQLAQGETINQLSERYGVPASAIRSANGLPAGSNGAPGSKVIIPVYNASSSAAPAAIAKAPAATPNEYSGSTSESGRDVIKPPAAVKPVAAPVTPQAKAALAADAKAKSAAEAKEKAVAAKAQAEADAKAMAERRARLTAEAKAKADGRPQVSAEQKAEQAELAKARAEEAKAKQELARLKADAKAKELAETKAKSDAKSKTVAAAKAETDAKTKAEAKLKAEVKAKADAEKKTAAAAAKKEQDSKKVAAAKPTEEASEPKTTGNLPKEQPKEKVEAAPAAPAESSADFRWPARGRVISGFSGKGGNEGINIAVPEGTPVKAAEGGTVAYAGNELKGYGNLVLIRHPNGYVSAYAHNGALSVKRGDAVKRGQVVATSGQSGNVASPQLHFELRKGSTPVDPSPYLSN